MAEQLWVDLENSNGTKRGSGPLSSVTDWKITQRVDRAGEFSFHVSLADPNYPSLASRIYVRAWQLLGGVMTTIGYGVIDLIQVDSVASPTVATVSGSNIMRELTWRTVQNLLIAESGLVSPDDFHKIELDSSGSGAEANPNLYTNYTNIKDGNAGTWDTINTADSFQTFYFGFSRIFAEVDWLIHTGNSTAATTKVQYFNGTGWIDLTITDTTILAGKAFGQTGTWIFTPPADWVPLVQNCIATGTTPDNNLNDYWLRFHLLAGVYTTVAIAEITIKTEIETLTGAQLIMALAPAGWTLVGHTSTLTAVYLQLSDETVLDALIQLALITGEHFRLSTTGTVREIEWIQIDAIDSGITILRNGDPQYAAIAGSAALATEVHISTDSYDLVSRVIPYGAGQADARLALALTTRTAPAGYTLSAANNYLKNDTAEGTYGQIERAQTWSNIGPATTGTADQIAAANALFDSALYWLSTHCVTTNIYATTAYGIAALIKPGLTLRLRWLEVVAGIAILNIDLDLIALEIAYTIDQRGALAVQFLLSDTGFWPLSQDEALAKLQGTVMSMRSIAQPVSPQVLNSPTLAISAKQTAAHFGGLNFGG